jgi:protein associated with RNAse G/E
MKVRSTKFDGSLHYEFEATEVGDDDGFIALYVPPRSILSSYRGTFPTSRHYLMLWWRDRGYELEVVWHDDWTPEMHYFNIGSSFEWTREVLSWVDLDLDVVWRHGSKPEIDDIDEFDDHRAKWNYPQALVDSCWEAVELIQTLIAGRVSPHFDESLYGWRPGDAIRASSAGKAG